MNKKILNITLFVIYDLISTIASIGLTFLLLGIDLDLKWPWVWNANLFYLCASPFLVVFFMYVFKLYNVLWNFSGFFDAFKIFVSVFAAHATVSVVNVALFSNSQFSLTFLIISYLINVIFCFGVRYLIKFRSYQKPVTESTISGNVMIIGAGSAGKTIISELSHHKGVHLRCAIDDDKAKHGQYISGVLIVGGREKIIASAEKYDIDTIIFAIPTCPLQKRVEILNICQETKCELKILPALYAFEDVDNFQSRIRKVEIEDLLGRPPIKINLEEVASYLRDKVVLVTGGGGTIGSELCRQIASQKPKQLIIFDVYENNAYEIQNELKHDFPELNLTTLIGSVRDSRRMDYLFRTYKPQIIYHAAAHKHVPLMEDSPNESIKNNVFGTYKTVQCAHKYGAEKFVLISTDKAVNPTNIMGASKRICEMIVQSYNNRSNTDFVAVRFGNVLGSNGSVIPLFKKQLEHGGPLTVTHPNIIRYFMTVPEAVSLVLQAGATAKGGEIFVLDMGEPVKILDLAENLIRLSGFTPYKDIQIEFTGLRPGEKLYEELLMSEEGLKDTENELIYIGHPIDFDEDELFETLDVMSKVMYNEEANMLKLVKKIVPTYQIPKNKQN
ncbi:MAG: polysaccharide biosynthesis protein [Clostridia bacterium]|nr:polysaccharide biosynthesis protein [Clostridia bacterium]